MKWLIRLKKIEITPREEPTKPTKPTYEPENRGFVGFVGPALASVQKTRADQAAANDPAPPPAKSVNPLEVSAPLEVVAPVDWRVLDAAYMAHHVNCLTCQAAGRGVSYSLRCGTGAALWREYSDAAAQPTESNNQKATP